MLTAKTAFNNCAIKTTNKIFQNNPDQTGIAFLKCNLNIPYNFFCRFQIIHRVPRQHMCFRHSYKFRDKTFSFSISCLCIVQPFTQSSGRI